MPVYEYRCTRCNHLFEEVHQVGGLPGPCPVCGGPARRVFTSVGLIFKGTGFHTTDYRKGKPAGDGASNAPSADSPAKTDAGASTAPTPSSTTPTSSD